MRSPGYSVPVGSPPARRPRVGEVEFALASAGDLRAPSSGKEKAAPREAAGSMEFHLPGPRIATGSAPDKARLGRKKEGRPRGTARVPHVLLIRPRITAGAASGK